MEIKKQVCSLELSKKLKELGVKQDSLFYWVYDMKDNLELIFGLENLRGDQRKATSISAFTVAELGEMLPDKVYSYPFHFGIEIEKWFCQYRPPYKKRTHIEEKTEANARAKMLIYLLENNLITV